MVIMNLKRAQGQMKHLFIALFSLVLGVSFFLAGCQHQNYSPEKNKNTSKICQERCNFVYNDCKNQCMDNCRSCCLKSMHSSALHYSRYLHEMKVQRTAVYRELNSYRDPLQCSKVTCSCSDDLKNCLSSC